MKRDGFAHCVEVVVIVVVVGGEKLSCAQSAITNVEQNITNVSRRQTSERGTRLVGAAASGGSCRAAAAAAAVSGSVPELLGPSCQ